VARVEAALKRLAKVLAGDAAVAQAAALLRIPGTHNSKNGEWTEVEVTAKHAGAYTIEELENWLEDAIPVLHSQAEAEDEADEFYPRVDVDLRLEQMTYHGPGDSGVHTTQVSVTAAMLNQGMPRDDVVEIVLAATRERVGEEGTNWNWAK